MIEAAAESMFMKMMRNKKKLESLNEALLSDTFSSSLALGSEEFFSSGVTIRVPAHEAKLAIMTESKKIMQEQAKIAKQLGEFFGF